MHILAIICLLLTSSQERLQNRFKTHEPYSGFYLPQDKEGVFLCTICELPLFQFKDQFDAGNGWPNFTHPIDKKNIYYEEDRSLGFKRYAVLCRGCNSPIGHVFHDGPPPKFLRYCIHSNYLKIDSKN